jgi:VanZ family protein
MRPVRAAILVAGMLFATSWAETYLPGRSAEITDALMTLLIAAGFALIGDRYRGRSIIGRPGIGPRRTPTLD